MRLISEIRPVSRCHKVCFHAILCNRWTAKGFFQMIPNEWQNVPAPHEVKAWKSDSRVIVLFQTIWHISSSPGIVFRIASGSVSQEKKKKANISVLLTLKTSVYHRCKFSASISKRSTHKFSVKINWVRLKKKKKKSTLKWEWLSLIFNALIETRQQNYPALFWWLHGFHQ